MNPEDVAEKMKEAVTSSQKEEAKAVDDMKELLGDQVQSIAQGESYYAAKAQEDAVTYVNVRGKKLPIPKKTKGQVESILIASLYSLNLPAIDSILAHGKFRWVDENGEVEYLFDNYEKQQDSTSQGTELSEPEEEPQKSIIVEKKVPELKKGDIVEVLMPRPYLAVFEKEVEDSTMCLIRRLFGGEESTQIDRKDIKRKGTSEDLVEFVKKVNPPEPEK